MTLFHFLPPSLLKREKKVKKGGEKGKKGEKEEKRKKKKRKGAENEKASHFKMKPYI